MPLKTDRCDQCHGQMRIDIELDMKSIASICTQCTDKPVDELTDGVAVGQSLEINPRQLKGGTYYV